MENSNVGFASTTKLALLVVEKLPALNGPLKTVFVKIILTPDKLAGTEAENGGKANVGEVVGGVVPPEWENESGPTVCVK
jgi:hypothetical protein